MILLYPLVIVFQIINEEKRQKCWHGWQQVGFWIDFSAFFVPEFQQCFEELLFQLWQNITASIYFLFYVAVSCGAEVGLGFVICGCDFCEFSLLLSKYHFYNAFMRKQLGIVTELIFWYFIKKDKVVPITWKRNRSICRLTSEINWITFMSVVLWGLVLDSLQFYSEQASRSAVFYRSLVKLPICKAFEEFYREMCTDRST